MNELFGQTRDCVKSRYALRTPSGYVPSWLPGWSNATPVVQISPEMGARFSQWQVTFEKNGQGRGNTGSSEYVVYLMTGSCAAQLAGKKYKLSPGSFAYVPPQTEFLFGQPRPGTRLLVFEKKYQALAGYEMPETIVGHADKVIGQPFLGNKDAVLQVLLPTDPAFDLAVNLFTYQPGATLPFVETHVMEHGLVMLDGQGIYRLDADWHPVQAGDVIWMASYCPQWFVAMGTTPACYIYYKDVNRPSLG
jgi:(S)-ureidoglycine aminohydrolase